MKYNEINIGMKVVPFGDTFNSTFQEWFNSGHSTARDFEKDGYLTVSFVYGDKVSVLLESSSGGTVTFFLDEIKPYKTNNTF